MDLDFFLYREWVSVFCFIPEMFPFSDHSIFVLYTTDVVDWLVSFPPYRFVPKWSANTRPGSAQAVIIVVFVIFGVSLRSSTAIFVIGKLRSRKRINPGRPINVTAAVGESLTRSAGRGPNDNEQIARVENRPGRGNARRQAGRQARGRDWSDLTVAIMYVSLSRPLSLFLKIFVINTPKLRFSGK